VRAPGDIQEFASTKAGTLESVGYLLKIADPAERAPIIQQLVDGMLVTKDLAAYIKALKNPQATDENQQVADTHAIEQAPSPAPEPTSSILPTEEVQVQATTSTPTLDESRANATPVDEQHSNAAETMEKGADEPVADDSKTRTGVNAAPIRASEIAQAHTQTAKLKTLCKHMEDFDRWLHEQHIPLSDVEHEMLEKHGALVQATLNKY
jgi:hypothetical protein